MPNAPRNAKPRRVNTRRLPDEPARYFKMTSRTKMVRVDKLVTIRARPDGIARAAIHMANSYNGTGEKRDPITVSANGDGTFTVEDGNSTTAVARKHGWKKLPVKIMLEAARGTRAGRRRTRSPRRQVVA